MGLETERSGVGLEGINAEPVDRYDFGRRSGADGSMEMHESLTGEFG